MSRSVWGLSAYTVQQGHSYDQVQAAAMQWARFIRPDYYVASEVSARGADPADYGLSTESSCFVGNCVIPFHDGNAPLAPGGCGGMGELIQ